MKSIRSIIVLGVVAGVITLLTTLIQPVAADYVTMNSSNPDPLSFLDTSSTAQSKQSWLALGSTPSLNPLAPLDVAGTTVTTYLNVIGTMWSNGKIKVGGTSLPTASDPKLIVAGSYVRSSALAGTGERPVCSDQTGLFKVCDSPVQTAGVCGPKNGTVQTGLTQSSTGLCAAGTVSGFSGTGPWSWSCAGINGGATVTCGTVAAQVPPPAPTAVFYSSIFSGGSGGAHDGIEWAPVIIPGTNTYAYKYEMQSFNPDKNFVEDPNTGEIIFSPAAAAANKWETFGVVDYSTGGIGGGNLIGTYQNWTSGTSNPWNARLWDFWGHSGSDWNTVNDEHNDNGCFYGNSIAGCAYRVRAINGSTPGPWSNIIVLYDADAPTNLACSVRNSIVSAAHPYQIGQSNTIATGQCSYPSGSTVDNTVKLTWTKSQYDNHSTAPDNAPFITYKVGVFCGPTNPGANPTVGIINASATTASSMITAATINNIMNNYPSCSGQLSATPVFYNYFAVLPNSDYPGTNFNIITYPGYYMPGEGGFIQFTQ